MSDDLFRELLLRLLEFPPGTPPVVAELCYRIAAQWSTLCRIEHAVVVLTLAKTKEELFKCIEKVRKESNSPHLISLINNRFLTYDGEKAYDMIMKTWVSLAQVLPSATVVLSFNVTAHWHEVQQQYKTVRSSSSDTHQQSHST